MLASELIDKVLKEAGLQEARFGGDYRIYIADLLAYNAGKLVGEWVDLPDEREVKRVMDKMSHGGRQDIAIHDYELPFRISEYTSPLDVNEFVEVIEDRDVPGPVVEWFIDYMGGIRKALDQADQLEDLIWTEADSETDLAYDLVDDMGWEGIGEQNLENYFDYESFGRDLGFDLDPDDPGDSFLLDMDDRERGEEYVDSVGWDGVGKNNMQQYFDYAAFGRDLVLGGDYDDVGGGYFVMPNSI